MVIADYKHRSGMLCIDPGLTGTGWAYFREPGGSEPTIGVVRASEGEWTVRAHEIANEIRSIVTYPDTRHLIIEFPGLWGSAKSQASAAKGDLFKLAYLVGAIGQSCSRLVITCKLISPQEWKGQLPKDLVIRRIKKVFPNLNVKNHSADAVGMGLALQGLL